MKRIRYIFRQFITMTTTVLLVGSTPAAVYADGATTPTTGGSATQTQPAANPGNGPTGSDAHTFTYNAGSGLWENDYYTYNPATQLQTPKVPLEYTCNPVTNKWDTTIWEYIASDDKYEQFPMSVSVVPSGAITHACPAPVTPPVTDSTTLPGSSVTPTTTTLQPVTDTPTTPPSSSDSSPNLTNTTGATLNTNVGSAATSGNALVLNNNDVGNIKTGNANANANIINMLQSQAAFAGSGVNTFTANIQGNVQGDFVIDPTTLAQPAAVNQSDLNGAKITNVTNGTINNNIVLNAASGNATADNNNDVASVATGDASAIADVINMINSVVAANQSFIGTINIYGDYTGNILMPADSLNALLASAGANTAAATTNSSVNTTDNMAINNNVNLGATSGTATASDNNDVGNISTGNAMTNLTILNLTGKKVVAANSLLVFVNVLGKWVGLIMDAPAGATSAALGGGVNSNATLANASNITNTGNFGINNNITAHATTGNATATNNNDVGAVSTGNALASVSLANLINSNFSLSNWFGVLFINVFGTWHGNFGVMKPPVVAPITSGAAVPGASNTDLFNQAKVFSFVPAGNTGSGNLKLSPVNFTSSTNNGGGGSGSALAAQTTAAVLGASHKLNAPTIPAIATAGMSSWSIILLTVGSAGLGFVAFERIRSSLRGRYISKI